VLLDSCIVYCSEVEVTGCSTEAEYFYSKNVQQGCCGTYIREYETRCDITSDCDGCSTSMV